VSVYLITSLALTFALVIQLSTIDIDAMATMSDPPATRNSFQIAVICALPEERDAVENAMTRDYKGEGHVYGKAQGDDNHYTTGELGRKPVVLATPRNMGTINTSHLVVNMRHSFPNLVCVLVVGIAGGAPFRYDKQTDMWSDSGIHLGDVIVSTQVIGYDFGAELDDSFRRKTAVEDVLPRAPTLISTFLNGLKTGKSKAFKRVLDKTNADLQAWGSEYERPMPETDRVYPSTYRHKHQDQAVCVTCQQCTEWHDSVCDRALNTHCGSLGCVPSRINERRDTRIHFGRVASGNAVMKSAHRRDKLIQQEGCIAFEMEGAGTWDVFGTIVVKGVVDYADSHKNKIWRAYPAARAALCAKALIEEIELADVPQSRHTGQ
jgi:nucleoside phosphorylase